MINYRLWMARLAAGTFACALAMSSAPVGTIAAQAATAAATQTASTQQTAASTAAASASANVAAQTASSTQAASAAAASSTDADAALTGSDSADVEGEKIYDLQAEVNAVNAQIAATEAAAGQSAEGLPSAPVCNVIYNFGGGRYYAVGPAMAMSMMRKNDDGSYYIDPTTHYYALSADAMKGFFAALQDMFPPKGASSKGFKATSGRIIKTVDPKIQHDGYIDVDKEMDYLTKAIMLQKQEVHKPSTTKGGGTYIEVDMKAQMLYYYENGRQKIKTAIVTGNTSRNMGTPEGVYTILKKMTDTNLVGPDYVSHVNYWMPIVGNSIGIHDATWRSKFGDSIYKTAGSHGCINVPLSVMEKLYPMVVQGTTVVVFN